MREIAVDLFCNGLGDVIAPKDPLADACRFISSVPQGHDFLCTSFDRLQKVSERAASSQACEVLAKDCFWHSPEPLFGSCKCHDSGNRDPFQQIIKVKIRAIFGKSKVLPPDNLVAEGAIIFGTWTSNLPEHEAANSQSVGFANELEPSKQRIDHVDHIDEARNTPNPHGFPQPPRLRRRAKNENFRVGIGQPNYFRQDQKNT